jgi:hypothetical protein
MPVEYKRPETTTPQRSYESTWCHLNHRLRSRASDVMMAT